MNRRVAFSRELLAELPQWEASGWISPEQAALLRARYALPVQMTCRYWLKDRAHWPDLVGLMQATADIISDERKRIGGKMVTTREWLLSDDRIIARWDGTEIAGIDKARPRVEIVITPLPADEALDPYVERQMERRM